MKKIFLMILALLLCFASVFSLASCDKEEPQKPAGDIFYTTFNGIKIELGAEAESTISALGEPNEIKQLGDCGGFGAQVKYVYDEFDIFTLKNDKGETIDGISFSNDIPTTSKGICLGDESSKITSEYGEPTQKSDKELRYTKDNFVLKFKLEDGKVTDIDYLRITQ